MSLTILKIDDVTFSVRFDVGKGEKKLLELVNACVSHEMRNPINAINAMNIKLKELTKEFEHLKQETIPEEKLKNL